MISRRATDYTLRSISIDSPRFGDKGAIDITSIVPEINIYESLHSPFLTGDMMLVDTTAISNEIMAQGQETIRIELFTDDDFPLTREFILYTVRKQSKQINASTSTYIYGLIEKHGFFSYFQRINRSYSGNIGGIIYDIYKNELYGKEDLKEAEINQLDADATPNESVGETDIEKALLNENNFETPYQNIKVISPNMTPLGFCKMLTERATTEDGEPFFLYSSLRSGPQFKSLRSLMRGEVINPSVPYRFSQVYTDDNLANEAYRIISLDFPENDNSIALARAGAFGILYQSIDPFMKTNDLKQYQIKFDQHKYFKDKVGRGSTYLAKDNKGGSFYDQNIYDENFRIGVLPEREADGSLTLDNNGNPKEGTPLHKLTSIIHSQVNTSMAFEDFSGYDEESFISNHLHKVSRRSELAFMDKRKLAAVLPGITLLNSSTNKTIGRVFDLRIPSDKIQLQGDAENLTDHKMTESMERGNFLATKVRHMFKNLGTDLTYTASIEFSKLATARTTDRPLEEPVSEEL